MPLDTKESLIPTIIPSQNNSIADDIDYLKKDNDRIHSKDIKEPLKPFVIHKKDNTETNDVVVNENKVYRTVNINTKEKFRQLEVQWNSLMEASNCLNPFVLWEWMYTWWEVFGDNNNKLFILVVYDGESLISIAPFYIQKRFKFFSRLGFIGEGEAKSDAITTHYPDIIVSKAHRNAVVNTIVDYLTSKLESGFLFDYARFDLIKPDAVINDVTNGLAKNLKTKSEFSGNQFHISLPKDDEEYIASLSKSARKQFRLKGNRLEKAGEVKIETEADVSKGLALIEKLHRLRWEKVVKTNVFDSENFTLFHNKLCERLAGQNIVDIRTMTLNGTAIVASYNFKYKKACFSYLSGFNSEDDSRLSPMFTFDLMEMKKLIREGYHSFDLLVSESDTNYKKRFGSEIIPSNKVLWIGNSSSSFAFRNYFSIKSILIKYYKKFNTP